MSPEFLLRTAPTPKSKNGLGSVVLVIGFLLTVLSASVVLRTLFASSAPYSAGEVLSEKLDALELNSREVSVFFVGTSHIYRSIAPAAFDAECVKAGVSVQSYNAGVFRLGYLEAEAMIDRIAEAKKDSEKPWLVVIEPSLRDCDFVNWNSERELYFHTPASTLQVVRFHWQGIQDDDSTLLNLRHAGASLLHGGSGLLHVLNYGRFARSVFPESEKFVVRTFVTPGIDGFCALDDEITGHSSGNANELPQELFESLLQRGTHQRSLVKRPPITSGIRFYEHLVSRIGAAGGKVVFVATPRFTPGYPRFGDDIEALLKNPPSLIRDRMHGDFRYSGPEQELYQSKYWFDAEHLNLSGARLFTTLLARRLISDGTLSHELTVSRPE